MKKRILVIIKAAVGGGAEKLVLDQMKYYDKDLFDLHVVALMKGHMEKEFIYTSACYTCFYSKTNLSIRTLKKILKYIHTHKIDLIHTHLYVPDIYGFLLKMAIPRIKLITTKHNTNDFRKKIYWGLLDNLLSWPACRIIAVSQSVKDFISKYEFIPQHRITMIYHGVDINQFKKKTNLIKLKQELNIKDDDFVIGIVGRMIKQKGHKYLLEAIAKLKDEISTIKLLIIGTGNLETSLKYYSKKLGIEKNVVFLGFRMDMTPLYSLMNILCLPSIFEGLGLVLVEAMLCQTITIGAEIHGITEVIQDGINGYLFPPKNSTALANIILKIYNSNFDKKIYEQAKKSTQRFDYKKNLIKIEKEYLRVLKI